MKRALRFAVATALPLAALGLHAVICASYLRRWDSAAALTVFPFWAWGVLGLASAGLSWVIFRGRFAFFVALLWLATTVAGSDETRPLLRFSAPVPEPGAPAPAPDGARVLRVITLNCKSWKSTSAAEVLPWQPDIVLLQETALPHALEEIAGQLYPDGEPSAHVMDGREFGEFECGIITRGRARSLAKNIVGFAPRVILSEIEFDDKLIVRTASVHLKGAVTDVRLWRPETLRQHAGNRRVRRLEMQQILSCQAFQSMLGGSLPALIGGDFNCNAGDSVFHLLERAGYQDAFAAAGSGWGNTFPNRHPLLRIDQIWSNSRLQPIRSRTVRSQNSDHRMVVCDFAVR